MGRPRACGQVTRSGASEPPSRAACGQFTVAGDGEVGRPRPCGQFTRAGEGEVGRPRPCGQFTRAGESGRGSPLLTRRAHCSPSAFRSSPQLSRWCLAARGWTTHWWPQVRRSWARGHGDVHCRSHMKLFGHSRRLIVCHPRARMARRDAEGESGTARVAEGTVAGKARPAAGQERPTRPPVGRSAFCARVMRSLRRWAALGSDSSHAGHARRSTQPGPSVSRPLRGAAHDPRTVPAMRPAASLAPPRTRPLPSSAATQSACVCRRSDG